MQEKVHAQEKHVMHVLIARGQSTQTKHKGVPIMMFPPQHYTTRLLRSPELYQDIIPKSFCSVCHVPHMLRC